MILNYKIPKEFKVSTNAIYAGIHWRKRKKIADYYHYISVEDCMSLKTIIKPVILRFEFYFKSRYLDASNCSFMWKMLEDWLVKNWLLKDDTNKYVLWVTYICINIPPKERKQMENDYCRIIIQ